MGYYPSARGHRMQRQAPDDYLLFYCVDGAGTVAIEGESFSVGAGEVVLFNRGVSHEYAARDDDPWSLYWVHFQGSNAYSFLHHMGYTPEQTRIFIGVSPALIALFNSLLEARRTGYSSHAFIHAANQLRNLFTQVALDAQTPATDEAESFNLANVQKYMRENLHSALDLDDIAAIAGLSKFHFSNRYRALTGYPPMRHFTHMKMEAACRLLDTTEQSIKRIAGSLGYDDPLYFSRAFRKVMGVAPKAYRASRSISG